MARACTSLGHVVFFHDFEHLGLFHLEPKRAHRDLQFMIVDLASPFGVKEVEGFFQLRLLLLSERLARRAPVRTACRRR
jgi:hypothetical protein